MRAIVAMLLVGLASQAWGEACVVHSQGKQVEVKVCMQNRTIPENLFRGGFCQPQLQGQKADVSFAEQCPAGAFGECRNAKVSGGVPYQQDIFYYGVASDARYLKPACEQQSKGVWMAR
ncbi:MAG TPA: NADH:ubiquinone oxidoreductase [Pseudomonas sp.]|nr:NADH:ubiquinone oxidoreductase [Pseudomonas sp.]